jgi:hypothetical protein
MIIGGTVAIAVDFVFGGMWYLIVGAVAGSVAGGFVDDRE